MARAGMVKKWRQATYWAVKKAQVPALERVRVEMHYVPSTKRRRDPDNLVASMKPICDGIVDAGVVTDDTEDYVDRVWPRIDEAKKVCSGRIYVIVTEVIVTEISSA